ncbi:MAG: bifunctional diaminohydroxyphosphoribosylaminopyrimidine deaminase/5-amino-6-(5-phosphoribosylamino)uracil reductase RibD [bacterium]|nr:bifunctional diaminohydroxyphosphoribosylaminopyrimidine deaminase/5-amino-6-(5-phosphoribosylamino)uracil reductase RibD [bacterium]
MARAIELARRAENQTEPNPMVGALLVSGTGEILSEGWHHLAGKPHAEVNALADWDQVPADSTLYVTLEPCNHQGRTPPCTQLILEKGVKNLVVGSLDPNPQMSGKSLDWLRSQGVAVQQGPLAQACYALNRVFNKQMLQKLPYVSAKAAVSLDGRIATATGQSQWITGPEARAAGHRLRSAHQAIGVGAATLNQDDPQLTDRHSDRPRNPVQVVFSTLGELNPSARFFQPREGVRKVILLGSRVLPARVREFEALGVDCLVASTPQIPPRWALEQLFGLGLVSLLLEGGAALIAGFLKADMVDRWCLFYAGLVMGQSSAPGFAGDAGLGQNLSDLPRWHLGGVERLGPDLGLEYYRRIEDVYRID